MLKFKDFLIKFYAFITALSVFGVIIYIFYFIFSRGISTISIEFSSTNPSGMILGESGGIKDAIIGSFLLMSLAMIFAGILGISTAIYRQFYCKNKFIKTSLKFFIQAMACIPSILLGLFVYGFFIVSLNLPKSLLTASITLSMMIFSFVEVSVEKIIKEIDKNSIRDSFALGVDESYMIIHLVLPKIKNSIISVLVVAGSYAIGATAPLLLTGVVFIAPPNGLTSPVMALPFHLHMLLSQGISVSNAYASALVLIAILVILHIVSALISINLGEKFAKYFKNRKS